MARRTGRVRRWQLGARERVDEGRDELKEGVYKEGYVHDERAAEALWVLIQTSAGKGVIRDGARGHTMCLENVQHLGR